MRGLLLLAAACAPATSWPRAAVVPQPDGQFAFEVDGREVARYHAGLQVPRPYVFPLIGPAGRSVIRLTHPGDPHGHRHHLGVWIGHNDVGGSDFWSLNPGSGRIVQEQVMKIVDGPEASLAVRSVWLDKEGKAVLRDERVWKLVPGEGGELSLELTLTLKPEAATLLLGKSNFGLIGVRVAKQMGVKDGGGTITSSEGLVNEAALMPHRPARWCDTSGTAAPDGAVNGVTLMDHPSNPGHPARFHVRDDGWMGIALTQEAPLEVSREKPLVVRYRLWVHDGGCDRERTQREWERWVR